MLKRWRLIETYLQHWIFSSHILWTVSLYHSSNGFWLAVSCESTGWSVKKYGEQFLNTCLLLELTVQICSLDRVPKHWTVLFPSNVQANTFSRAKYGYRVDEDPQQDPTTAARIRFEPKTLKIFEKFTMFSHRSFWTNNNQPNCFVLVLVRMRLNHSQSCALDALITTKSWEL